MIRGVKFSQKDRLLKQMVYDALRHPQLLILRPITAASRLTNLFYSRQPNHLERQESPAHVIPVCVIRGKPPGTRCWCPPHETGPRHTACLYNTFVTTRAIGRIHYHVIPPEQLRELHDAGG